MTSRSGEPQIVRDARHIIRQWELRDGHDAYAEPLGGGYRGYQGACHDCDWRGAEYLRGDEELGTEASRAHKRDAQREAEEHRQATLPAAAAIDPLPPP
jgi:hypothetical protein